MERSAVEASASPWELLSTFPSSAPSVGTPPKYFPQSFSDAPSALHTTQVSSLLSLVQASSQVQDVLSCASAKTAAGIAVASIQTVIPRLSILFFMAFPPQYLYLPSQSIRKNINIYYTIEYF